ncbi:MAG: hypothetical protein FJW94_13350 [Actinobacteria bacterium]|nr:hypothetical protein [Actinomycetota bacterium]
MTDTEAASVASTEASSSTVAPTDAATRMFSRSIVISGIRCMLAYVVFPWILPLFGVATGVGPFIGIVIGVVAIGFNVASIRRFWISKHRWRHAIAVLNGSVIVLLTILLWIDLRDLVA